MGNTLKLRRSAVAGVIPAAANLSDGEIAINTADKALYAKDTSGAVVLLCKAQTQEALANAASVVLDFGGAPVKVLTLAQACVFTTANKAAAGNIQVILSGGASARSLTWPSGWIWLGNAAPTTLPASKTAVLSLYCKGIAESDVIAAWAVQA